MNPPKKNSTPSPLEIRIKTLESEIEALQTSLDQAKEAQVRALADLENVRRRETAAKANWTKEAVKHFLQKVIPSFLELSLGAEHSEDEAMKKVVEKFFTELQSQGVESIAPNPGDPIDPELHEVLMMAEGKSGCVVQCLEVGWQYQSQTIIPAKVSGAQ